MEEVRKFLKEIDEKVKPLFRERNLRWWDAVLSGKDGDYKKYELMVLKIKKIFEDKKTFEKLKDLSKKDFKDIIVNRQIKSYYDIYLSNQGDPKLMGEIIKRDIQLEKKFNVFRAEIDGRKVGKNEIEDIMLKETDSNKLKQTWEAFKKVGEMVSGDVIGLVKLRNKLAKSLGFEDYYEMSMELGEQKTKDVKKIFDELDKLSHKEYVQLKDEIDEAQSRKYGIKKSELRPWHYEDLFFQEGPKVYSVDADKYYKDKDVIGVAKKFYGSIGLEVKDILGRSDLYERDGKYPHACCNDMDRYGDVRIIENVQNNSKWMDTTLHELGHAVYGKGYSTESEKELPFILRDSAHTFVTEAIALLFGRLAKSPDFIGDYCGFEVNKEDRKKLFLMSRLRQLVFSRWVFLMFNFEREMYKNPDQNLNLLWWKMAKKYQLINFSKDSPDWASKIHLVTSPVYYHNYLLGELMASQLHHVIIKKIVKKGDMKNFDYSGKKEIAKFLGDEIFKRGMKYRWDELIKMATGEKLTAKYFVEQFVSD